MFAHSGASRYCIRCSASALAARRASLPSNGGVTAIALDIVPLRNGAATCERIATAHDPHWAPTTCRSVKVRSITRDIIN